MTKLTLDRVKMNSICALICIRVEGIQPLQQGCAMVSKCANKCCLTPRHPDEGKIFRLDINLGNKAGGSERKTAYIWLCASCAQKLHPKVQVVGNTITLLLSKNDPMRAAKTDAAAERVN